MNPETVVTWTCGHFNQVFFFFFSVKESMGPMYTLNLKLLRHDFHPVVTSLAVRLVTEGEPHNCHVYVLEQGSGNVCIRRNLY